MARANARAAAAQARRASVALRAARASNKRRQTLGKDVLSTEDIERSQSAADQAMASRSEAGAAASAERTRVAQLERMLTETTITAPFAGKISETFPGPGETVSRCSPVVRLIAADELRVDFVFPLEDKSRYQIGDEIKIALEGTNASIKGIVRRIAPDLDPVAQMVTAQAELHLEPDQRALIRTGMGVWVNPAKERPADTPLD
jgi:multidrug resistance efflux pump